MEICKMEIGFDEDEGGAEDGGDEVANTIKETVEVRGNFDIAKT